MDKKVIIVKFHYKWLPRFYKLCGKLGHVVDRCSLRAEIEEHLETLKFIASFVVVKPLKDMASKLPSLMLDGRQEDDGNLTRSVDADLPDPKSLEEEISIRNLHGENFGSDLHKENVSNPTMM
uniref:Uncharacterized protein n=1 Tax=Nelumbo nucifera TaxID=4432 RepID=A0A822XKJ8_NELNU|nr:TPA_asm: hypothetical protein HUJ06_023567 [Nelumbo nucifera]